MDVALHQLIVNVDRESHVITIGLSRLPDWPAPPTPLDISRRTRPAGFRAYTFSGVLMVGHRADPEAAARATSHAFRRESAFPRRATPDPPDKRVPIERRLAHFACQQA
jgi:hypothetical protein